MQRKRRERENHMENVRARRTLDVVHQLTIVVKQKKISVRTCGICCGFSDLLIKVFMGISDIEKSCVEHKI